MVVFLEDGVEANPRGVGCHAREEAALDERLEGRVHGRERNAGARPADPREDVLGGRMRAVAVDGGEDREPRRGGAESGLAERFTNLE